MARGTILKGGTVICTTGIWTVKRGREDEFARRWQESADRVALDFPNVRFRLLRDHDNRQRFVSLGEGWRNHEQVQLAQSAPGYQDSMASIWRLLESGELSTLELVAEIS
jgi:quinol monooxygenase YgiN